MYSPSLHIDQRHDHNSLEQRALPLLTVEDVAPATPTTPIAKQMAATSGQMDPATSASHVAALARRAMKEALDRGRSQEAGVNDMEPASASGITVDLSHQNIRSFPEEVVDIVKDRVERLALSHNQLSDLPVRISDCLSLRYLNIRANSFDKFPPPLCGIRSLEILDLGRNALQCIPYEIKKLSALKVLSVQKNQIRHLPVCLAEMSSLQVLKFNDNPISFPPADVLCLGSSHHGLREGEVSEVSLTAHIKTWLKRFATNERARVPEDEATEGTETSRLTAKRTTPGRFPVKVNGNDLATIRSPNKPAPPLPTRSHYRVLSQQNAAARRPSVLPLIIGQTNDRLRSNSENILSAARTGLRARRKGVVPKQLHEALPVGQTIRPNHYRFLSHGSATQGSLADQGPTTPTEPYLQRPVYIRRLSVLPEHRSDSTVVHPIVEAAEGILHSVFQVHPAIQSLLSLTNDEFRRRSSLQVVFYNASSHVEDLEQEIGRYNTSGGEHGNHVLGAYRACQTLISAYGHVCTLLVSHADSLVDNGNSRYTRSLLLHMYNSIMEIRATLLSLSEYALNGPGKRTVETFSDTIQPEYRQRLATETNVNGFGSLVGKDPNATVSLRATQPFPSPVRSSQLPWNNSQVNAAVLRSQFRQICASLSDCAHTILRILPGLTSQLTQQLGDTRIGRHHDWKHLIGMCTDTISRSGVLSDIFPSRKEQFADFGTENSFWHISARFIRSWAALIEFMATFDRNVFPRDTGARLKPIQQKMKAATQMIVQSPWSDLFAQSNLGLESPPPIPITPQSATLGPALQATVPSTSTNASFAAVFHGNVFERADTLLANPGISLSRGTMRRKHDNGNSQSSSSSFSSGDARK
ncbi:RAM signaling network component [Purpureocillium takamizusanense]|uniref:RAM signaling network component n=1 Tax=Purpureocillium takamizusanense TaxID=2060973 RepID=A0A9Q8V862_9HYPO|nr:RAM signaling network component [Purpureocillium takamizusanense]UNI16745.1 RAM signaling network component [Purpureocillium takamizusanense]